MTFYEGSIVLEKTLIFGIVKNYFRTTLIEKCFLGLETNFYFFIKGVVWLDWGGITSNFISWMDVVMSKSFWIYW
jgi:hypothetical protein